MNQVRYWALPGADYWQGAQRARGNEQQAVSRLPVSGGTPSVAAHRGLPRSPRYGGSSGLAVREH